MKVLDLFCGAGGGSRGYAAAGYEVVGVDLQPQPNYPFAFYQGNALEIPPWFLRGVDLVHASPPCLAFTAYRRRINHVKPAMNLIPETRRLLQEAGVPWVIENVGGARHELRNPVQLCGSSFGLDVRRHRYFESEGFTIPPVTCDHSWQTPRFPPATNRTNLRSTCEVGVWRIPLDTQLKAMGLEGSGMTRPELSLAIPPKYTEHIGRARLT